ncbi:MAG: helix-turn-helix domain-containing protein [Candidatus Aenigmatarchaeota archaeon]
MEQKILEEIGLANSEIIIYRALLRTGSVKVGELMKEVALHRSRVYDAINRLIDKGLVSYVIKNNIKYFEASDPEKLVSYIEEQKEKLNQKEMSVKKLIPELRKKISPTKPHAEAHVFLGKEGFKTVRKDVLRQKQDIYMIGAIGKEDKFVKYFFPGFNRLRIKNKIKWKVLFDHEVKNKNITKLELMWNISEK